MDGLKAIIFLLIIFIAIILSFEEAHDNWVEEQKQEQNEDKDNNN